MADLTEFARAYAERARADHHLFVAAFRADQIPGVTATQLTSPACRGAPPEVEQVFG